MKSLIPLLPAAWILAAAAGAADESAAWWNPAWTQRQPLTVDPAAGGVSGETGPVSVLLRLSDANFPFAAAREDGSDLRIVAEDGRTPLPYQIESWDNLLNEAFVWVGLPSADKKRILHLYSGNPAPDTAPKAADAFDPDTVLVWHFSEIGGAPADSTSHGNNATAPAPTAAGSLIGNGLRLAGAPVEVPASASLAWTAGQELTFSLWFKAAALQDQAVLASRGDAATGFGLLLNQGVPLVRIGGRTSTPGEPVAVGTWNHLAVTVAGNAVNVYLNGEPAGTLDAALPALDGPISLGSSRNGFAGEIDELAIARNAWSPAAIKLAAASQGAGDQRVVSLGSVEGGETEGGSHLMEHLSLFGDIARNMMFDGWIAIGVCAVMIVVGWTVAVRKFLYLNSIEKGTQAFLSQWKELSTDLTALDPGDHGSVSSLGGQADTGAQATIAKSPLFHIYQIGVGEIRHRLDKDGTRVQGLSGRSIQAIRASLDAGLVHESHRLSNGLVYLTISIAGGPYVGLLGTVVGVMITFAIIAKSGEVNVNSIAPGIASALLATVVGLIVAIPALFIYSYLNGRIKNALGLMQVFIDEFVAKMAEFYRPPHETDPSGGSGL